MVRMYRSDRRRGAGHLAATGLAARASEHDVMTKWRSEIVPLGGRSLETSLSTLEY
jgi:hypothetical protein